jgi:hypothetical protein
VAQALALNLFAHPGNLASLLQYVHNQLSIPTNARPSLEHIAGTWEGNTKAFGALTEIELFGQGLVVFLGRIIRFDLIIQDNAVPLKTDKAARAFGCLRLGFATTEGERILTIDDEFLGNPDHWNSTADFRPALITLASMGARWRDYWEVNTDGGMMGHALLSHFKFLDVLNTFYLPKAAIVTDLSLLIEALRGPDQSEKRFLEGLCGLCRQIRPYLVAHGGGVALGDLVHVVDACQLPTDGPRFYESFEALVVNAVIEPLQTLRTLYPLDPSELPAGGSGLPEELYYINSGGLNALS